MSNEEFQEIFMFVYFMIKLSFISPQLYNFVFGIIAVVPGNTFPFFLLTS